MSYIDTYGKERTEIISATEIKNIKIRKNIRGILSIEKGSMTTKWKPYSYRNESFKKAFRIIKGGI